MNNPSDLAFAFEKTRVQPVISQRKQPVQTRAQVTCDAILEATVQVLLREGADRLTTTRVAKRAGVSVGTLYQYYPNKSALIEAVRAQYFDLMSNAVRAALANATQLSAEAVISQALTAVIEVKRTNRALSLALAALPTGSDRADFAASIVQHFAGLLGPLLSQDGAPSEADTARALTTVAAIEGALGYAVKNSPAWLDEPWFQARLCDIAKAGLGPQGPAA